MRDRAEVGIVDDALEELRIFATACSRLGKEKFVEADGGGAEGIGLEHVGAGLEIFLVDALDCVGAGEEEQLVRAFEVFPFPIAKAFSAIIVLAQVEALEGCAHGAIEHDDALAEQSLEGMEFVGHGKRKKPVSEPFSRNKLTYHDASMRLPYFYFYS
jgi:hypothetical protein